MQILSITNNTCGKSTRMCSTCTMYTVIVFVQELQAANCVLIFQHRRFRNNCAALLRGLIEIFLHFSFRLLGECCTHRKQEAE